MRGDLLDGYYTSRPCVHDDGTVYFAREGFVMAAKGVSVVERVRLPMPLKADGVFRTRVLAGRDGLFSTCSTNLSPKRGSSDHPPGQVSTLVRLSV